MSDLNILDWLDSWNLLPHIVLIISQLSDIVQKSFRMDQMSYVQAGMFVAREIKQKPRHKFNEFFCDTLYIDTLELNIGMRNYSPKQWLSFLIQD